MKALGSKIYQKFGAGAHRRYVKSFAGKKYHRISENMLNSPIYWFEEVESTMDTAKQLLGANQEQNIFAVFTERQTKGRGTHGRQWQMMSHNLALTIALKRQSLPISLQYLPLRSGTLVAESIAKFLPATIKEKLKLKWPNDILIEGRKVESVSGMLIEMEGDYLLVGIGCNVMSLPEIPSTGENGGRLATCLREYNEEMSALWKEYLPVRETRPPESSGYQLATEVHQVDFHKKLALEIISSFRDWLQQFDRNDVVIEDFSRLMDYSPQKRRDLLEDGKNIVIPLGLNSDGTLRVNPFP